MRKTNILGIGDLVLDNYYDKEREIVHTSLGGSVFNSITLLDKDKFNKHLLLYYGEDASRKLETHCSKFNINKGISIKLPKHNKTFNISLAGEDISDIERNWYNISELDIENVLKYTIDEDINVVVFDTLKGENIDLSKKLRKMGVIVFADVSYICLIKKMDTNELLELLTDSFDFLQLNKEAFEYISDKLGAYGSDLARLLKLKILSVTEDTKNIFYTPRNLFVRNVKTYIEDPIDVTGAGDAFFSVFIEKLIDNCYLVNEKLFNVIMDDSKDKILPILQKISIH